MEEYKNYWYIRDQERLAKGYFKDDTFVLVKGSTITRPSETLLKINKRAGRVYVRLLESGMIKDGKLVGDYAFASSSMAASMVYGENVSGGECFVNLAGKKLKSEIKKGNFPEYNYRSQEELIM